MPTKPRSPSDACGAKCSECSTEWRCEEADQDCEVPYVMHRCPMCETHTYMPPYWLHKGVVLRDRRTQELFGIVAVQLCMTRQDSSVEVVAPELALQRSNVIRVGVADIEAHFEPTPQKLSLTT